MNRTSLFLTAGGLFIVVAAGCQAIAGLESRTTDPQLTGCSLPSSGAGRVRLANMANVAGNTDFCIRTSGSSDWGRPVFRDGGNDALCLGTTASSSTPAQPGGLGYAQSTVPFAVPVGKIDVKAIPAGSTCAVAGTSEKDGIAVGDNATSAVVTLVRWGGGTSAEGISGLPERAKAPADTSTHVRIVNALSGGKALTAGISDNSFLPATVDQVVVKTPFSPGSVPAAQGSGTELFAVDASGYMGVLDLSINVAAAFASDTAVPPKAITLYATPGAADTATFYVIGDPNDATNGHVVRGLYCEDGLSEAQAAGAAAAADAGTGAAAHDRTLLQQCTPAQLPVLSVDMLNAALYGADAPFEQYRAALMPAAVAARTSDLTCVVEVEAAVNRTAIIKAAAGLGSSDPDPPATGTGAATNPGWYKYYYEATTDSTTPFTNTADNKPLPQNAPCSPSAVSSALADAMFQCVDSKCSSAPAGQDGGIGQLSGTTSCLTGPCVSPLGRLYTTPAPSDRTSSAFLDDACLDCAVYYFTSEVPLSEAESECTTNNTEQPFAFDGATPSFILSHHPLKNTSTYVLAATGYRRAVLKAQVVLEDQSVIDFFCAQLSSPLIDSSLPYTGNYGSDVGANGNGWQDEQDVQAAEAVAWIQSETAKDGVPAIIASDLHADVASGGAGFDGGISSLSPEVIATFNAAFTPAVPVNYTPVCDYCPSPQNPYNAGTVPNELMHTFVQGFPTNATQTETLWGTDNSQVVISQGVPGEVTPPGGTGPLLEFYAHNYTILRP